MRKNDNNELTLYTNFRVSSADTDMEARLRPGALVNFLIQSAIQSADSLGFGFGNLSQEQLFWVLSRMVIEIYRPLKWNEEIIVETWPKDVDGLLYLRDFIIRDKKGAIVVKATSGWLAINFKSKRPGKVEGIGASFLDRLRSKHALEAHPEKLPTIQASAYTEKVTTYFDLDLNKHVTSTRYIDWMIDSIPVDYLATHYPSKVIINYMKETHLGDVILLQSNESFQQTFVFEGINKFTNQISFRARIEFFPLNK
jgi:medium-chain acyl-[acyl-carrier-protein] hydrolase